MQKELPDLDKYQSSVAGSIPPPASGAPRDLALLSHLQLRTKGFGLNLSLFSLTLLDHIEHVVR